MIRKHAAHPARLAVAVRDMESEKECFGDKQRPARLEPDGQKSTQTPMRQFGSTVKAAQHRLGRNPRYTQPYEAKGIKYSVPGIHEMEFGL